jgi:peptidoglycan/xylan/chitin deacetylase (PgdA/CDA1 family)
MNGMARHARKKTVANSLLTTHILFGFVIVATLTVMAWRLVSAPHFMLFGTLISRVATEEKVVALTFDDGPLPGTTEETLRLLKQVDVHATFFVIGKEAGLHSKQLRAIVHDGHAVGNHSFTHQALIFSPLREIDTELTKTDKVIRAAGYTGEIAFRAPYNVKFLTLPLYLATHERIDVSRDVLPLEGSKRTAQQIANEVVQKTRSGSIILLHPMYKHTRSSRQAIPLIVKELRSRGYKFVTVPELLTYR